MIGAMALRIVPWPYTLANINPDWLLLALIYWTIAAPERVGIFHGWFFGLLADVLMGGLLGQYALAYTLVSYICLRLHRQLRQYPLLQQTLCVFVLLFLAKLLLYWTENVQHPFQPQPIFWLSIVSGTLCWPVVFALLRQVRMLARSL